MFISFLTLCEFVLIVSRISLYSCHEGYALPYGARVQPTGTRRTRGAVRLRCTCFMSQPNLCFCRGRPSPGGIPMALGKLTALRRLDLNDLDLIGECRSESLYETPTPDPTGFSGVTAIYRVFFLAQALCFAPHWSIVWYEIHFG